MDNKQENPLLRKKAVRVRWVRRFFATIMAFILIVVIFFFALQFEIRRIGKKSFYTVETVPETYTALVLGAQAFPDLTPSLMLQERLDIAIALFKAGKVKTVLVSGDHGTEFYDEVNTMRIYLLEQGIPADAIYLDHEGFDTYDSIYRARDIFQVPSLTICTQEYHAYRAVYIAETMGLEAFACPAPNLSAYRLTYNEIRESLARVKAFYDTQVLKRPALSTGEVKPITEYKGRSTWDKSFD